MESTTLVCYHSVEKITPTHSYWSIVQLHYNVWLCSYTVITCMYVQPKTSITRVVIYISKSKKLEYKLHRFHTVIYSEFYSYCLRYHSETITQLRFRTNSVSYSWGLSLTLRPLAVYSPTVLPPSTTVLSFSMLQFQLTPVTLELPPSLIQLINVRVPSTLDLQVISDG